MAAARSRAARAAVAACGRAGGVGGRTGSGTAGGSGNKGWRFMNDATKHEIVVCHQAGLSMRAIARHLGVSRGTVAQVLAAVRQQRSAGVPQPRPRLRRSIVDDYEPIL